MPALKVRERIRNEKINGEIFDMSPAPHYRHSEICGRLFHKIFGALEDSVCSVFMENLDYVYNSESDDYLEPDIIICCDPKEIKGGSYYGTPKFIAEVLSPSTAKRDKGIKKDIYERAGVEEYWIISPIERGVDIFYLENGSYVLYDSYIIDDDEESEYYNAKTEITLKNFPITMTLEELFRIKQ